MSRFFEVLTKRNSGAIAKKRLQFLLVSDRAGCTPELLEMIKDDMIKSISKYMEVDTNGVEITITQAGEGNPKHPPVSVFPRAAYRADRAPVLCASVPIRVLFTKGNYL